MNFAPRHIACYPSFGRSYVVIDARGQPIFPLRTNIAGCAGAWIFVGFARSDGCSRRGRTVRLVASAAIGTVVGAVAGGRPDRTGCNVHYRGSPPV